MTPSVIHDTNHESGPALSSWHMITGKTSFSNVEAAERGESLYGEMPSDLGIFLTIVSDQNFDTGGGCVSAIRLSFSGLESRDTLQELHEGRAAKG